MYLDAIHLKLRRDGNGQNTAVSIVLGVDVAGGRAVLGHWVGDGAEGANVWLRVVTDLQARGLEDIFIVCIDGFTGFTEAIRAVFPRTHMQRCVIHQVRHALQYVSWNDRTACVSDVQAIYHAPPRESAETKLVALAERWGTTYAAAVRSWEHNGEALATLFAYPPDMRRLMYTTNTVEGYNRQLRTVVKTKGAFPSGEAARTLLFLANRDSTRTWLAPVHTWAKILNQLAIRFGERFPA